MNSSTEPVSVMIRLSSTKLVFPDSTTPGRLDQATTLAPGANDFTVKVTTQARATFPMVIEIRTPDGNELLASSKVTIRSTALRRRYRADHRSRAHACGLVAAARLNRRRAARAAAAVVVAVVGLRPGGSSSEVRSWPA